MDEFKRAKVARNSYVRRRLLEMQEQDGHGFQAKVVAASGYTSAYVSDFLSDKKGHTGEFGVRVAKALWGLNMEQLDALVAEDAAKSIGSSQTHDNAQPDRSSRADAWEAFAEEHPAFHDVADAKLGQAAARGDGSEPLVRAALNIAARDLPRHYGGAEHSIADVRRAFERAWAIVNDEEPVELAPKVLEPAAQNVELQAVDAEAETPFQRRLREEREKQTTTPPPGRVGRRIVLAEDETHHLPRSAVLPKGRMLDADTTILPRAKPKKGR